MGTDSTRQTLFLSAAMVATCLPGCREGGAWIAGGLSSTRRRPSLRCFPPRAAYIPCARAERLTLWQPLPRLIFLRKPRAVGSVAFPTFLPRWPVTPSSQQRWQTCAATGQSDRLGRATSRETSTAPMAYGAAAVDRKCGCQAAVLLPMVFAKRAAATCGRAKTPR